MEAGEKDAEKTVPAGQSTDSACCIYIYNHFQTSGKSESRVLPDSVQKARGSV